MTSLGEEDVEEYIKEVEKEEESEVGQAKN